MTKPVSISLFQTQTTRPTDEPRFLGRTAFDMEEMTSGAALPRVRSSRTAFHLVTLCGREV